MKHIKQYSEMNESVRELMKGKSNDEIINGLEKLTQKEKDGKLLSASEEAFINNIKYLLEVGANINTTDEFGWTPLLYAVNSGDLETVKYLVEHGADILHRNINGYNAIHISIDANYSEITDYLRSKIK